MFFAINPKKWRHIILSPSAKACSILYQTQPDLTIIHQLLIIKPFSAFTMSVKGQNILPHRRKHPLDRPLVHYLSCYQSDCKELWCHSSVLPYPRKLVDDKSSYEPRHADWLFTAYHIKSNQIMLGSCNESQTNATTNSHSLKAPVVVADAEEANAIGMIEELVGMTPEYSAQIDTRVLNDSIIHMTTVSLSLFPFERSNDPSLISLNLFQSESNSWTARNSCGKNLSQRLKSLVRCR